MILSKVDIELDTSNYSSFAGISFVTNFAKKLKFRYSFHVLLLMEIEKQCLNNKNEAEPYKFCGKFMCQTSVNKMLVLELWTM